MTKRWIDWLGGSPGIVVLGGILLLAAHVDAPRGTVPEASISERPSALVACILPVATDDPLAQAPGVPEAIPPDCGASASDPLRSAWMTAC
jgi:hypothetical protein